MKPNQGRESAYVTSRVKDLSLITNTPDYVGCFACITPKAHGSLEDPENVTYMDAQGNPTTDTVEENKVYLPQLVRDVDTLDMLFGDPRIDPKTYKDLYAVRYIVQNGFACYIAKVRSGDTFKCSVNTDGLFSNESVCPTSPQLNTNSKLSSLKSLLKEGLHAFEVSSSIVGNNVLKVRLIPFKPYSLNQVSLEVVFETQASATSDVTQVASARVLLTPDTKNADLVSVLNSYLGGDVIFSLPSILDDRAFATVGDASEMIEPDNEGEHYICLANALLHVCGIYDFSEDYLTDLHEGAFPELLMDNLTLHQSGDAYGLEAVKRDNNPNPSDKNWPTSYSNNGVTFVCGIHPIQNSVIKVSPSDYTRSFSTFKDVRYAGTFISDLSSDKSYSIDKECTLYLPERIIVGAGGLSEGTYYYDSNEGTEGDPNWTEFTIDDDPTSIPTYTVTVNRTVYSDEELTTVVSESDLVDGTTYYTNANEGTSETPSAVSFVYNASEPNIPTRTETLDHTVYSTESFVSVSSAEQRTPTYALTSYFYNVKEGTSELAEYAIISSTERPTYTLYELGEITSDERRGLHYIIKDVASSRKDLVCVFSTPYQPYDNGYDPENPRPVLFDLDRACNWVAARGEYSDLFDYGTSNTTSYSEQAFYCEMYWSWLKWRVVKLVNGLATGSATVNVPASAFVILNALSSFRSRGTFFPVAGDQGGVLPDSCTILQNPSTKAQRDKLISYRINPIFDTGVRGIQIYGNDTLNPQYTDLSAAHIARTLVNIRSRVDAYSETIKFSLNNQLTWGSWITYVTQYILEPIKATGGLQWYQVDMGYNTTTRDEIAQRKIRGMVSLQFTQALEIIDLEFVVYASSLDMEAEL